MQNEMSIVISPMAYITSRVKGLKRWTVLYVNKLWVYAQTHRHTSKHVNMGHAKKKFSALLIRSVKSYPLVGVKKKKHMRHNLQH